MNISVVGMQSLFSCRCSRASNSWDMPGYEDKIIMAGGTLCGWQGSSIELSADGPMRPPYTIFMQGVLYSNIQCSAF